MKLSIYLFSFILQLQLVDKKLRKLKSFEKLLDINFSLLLFHFNFQTVNYNNKVKNYQCP